MSPPPPRYVIVSEPGQAVRRIQEALAEFAEGWYPDDMAVLAVQRAAVDATG